MGSKDLKGERIEGPGRARWEGASAARRGGANGQVADGASATRKNLAGRVWSRVLERGAGGEKELGPESVQN